MNYMATSICYIRIYTQQYPTYINQFLHIYIEEKELDSVH